MILAHPDAIGQVLLGEAPAFRTHRGDAGGRSLFGERSLLFADGAHHLALRRALLPSFGGERLRGYAKLIGERMREEIARWPTGEPFALWPRLHSVAIDAILQVTFGTCQPADRSLLTELIADRAIDRLQAALLAEVGLRRRAGGDEEADGVLGALLAASSHQGEPLADEDVRDQLLTVLIAGQEPPAIAACWTMEHLSRHPEKLDRLEQEVVSDGGPYLDAVVKEALRTRPPVPLVSRVLGEPADIAGHRLPAGTSVAPCALLVQRRADVYPEPWRFEPERFLDTAPPPNAWIPFGAGVHRCLGASLAVVGTREIVRTVVSRRRVRPAREEPETMVPVPPNLRPSGGAEIVVEARLGG